MVIEKYITIIISSIKQLLSWIYFDNCYVCHKIASSGQICKKCYEKIELISPEPIRIINDVQVYSASLYAGDLKKLIRGLKYHNQKEIAQTIAKLIFDFWQELKIDKDGFEIVPMPLHTKKQRQRGYNHVSLIAVEFSKLTGYPVNNGIAKRIRNTKPQYKLSRAERILNLKDAFEINPKNCKHKKLLLMDDICTSGITFLELIKEFKKHNITDLCAIVGATPVVETYN